MVARKKPIWIRVKVVISGNVDNDMNVRFICKRRSSPISCFFPRNAPLKLVQMAKESCYLIQWLERDFHYFPMILLRAFSLVDIFRILLFFLFQLVVTSAKRNSNRFLLTFTV